MATTTAPAPPRAHGRVVAATVVLSALVGIAVAAAPSVALVLDPPVLRFCPAVLPPATSCAPHAHLVVVAVAVAVLAVAWLVADTALRRVAPWRWGAVAVLGAVALITWSAARVPQPYLSAWYGWWG